VKNDKNIKAFNQLGKLMLDLGNSENWKDYSIGITKTEYEQLEQLINKQFVLNGWFTKENVKKSLVAIGELLTLDNLNKWISSYTISGKTPKKVGVIMAGNIPLVGFHDFLSVILSGNKAVCKLSSDDNTLLPALATHLINFEPSLKEQIEFTAGKIGEIDAIIATGSDNSMKYFEQYFGHLPHIFRKNRTSLAVLSGKESKKDLSLLGKDIFQYFGLGCRNVSHLLLPEKFNTDLFFEAIVDYHEIVNHHKYANNYDYNKAVYLMNKSELLDNNFVLLRKTEELFSPLGMVNYHFYENKKEVEDYITLHKEKIQVVVGEDYTPFGDAQNPTLSDYADGIDTMDWLTNL